VAAEEAALVLLALQVAVVLDHLQAEIFKVPWAQQRVAAAQFLATQGGQALAALIPAVA
jgi:hypothetical protein